MHYLPGLLLAISVALTGQLLANAMALVFGLHGGAVSGIMMAILLGILIGNSARLPDLVRPGLHLAMVRVLRIGIVLLGIRLSLIEASAIGLKGVPIIACTLITSLVSVTLLARRFHLATRLGLLIAVGTSICGATAIMAIAPVINARRDEVSYAVACITLFGIAAMLIYPLGAHWLFAADSLQIGLFLGTAVHETAQVAGAGLVYQQHFADPRVLDVATVTKLVRNLGMLAVIPLVAAGFYRRTGNPAPESPSWLTMVPLFVVGFAMMSALRTWGDFGNWPLDTLDQSSWKAIVSTTRMVAELCLGIAMAAVGLGTRISTLRELGLRPMLLGLFAALAVGLASAVLILLLY